MVIQIIDFVQDLAEISERREFQFDFEGYQPSHSVEAVGLMEGLQRARDSRERQLEDMRSANWFYKFLFCGEKKGLNIALTENKAAIERKIVNLDSELRGLDRCYKTPDILHNFAITPSMLESVTIADFRKYSTDSEQFTNTKYNHHYVKLRDGFCLSPLKDVKGSDGMVITSGVIDWVYPREGGALFSIKDPESGRRIPCISGHYLAADARSPEHTSSIEDFARLRFFDGLVEAKLESNAVLSFYLEGARTEKSPVIVGGAIVANESLPEPFMTMLIADIFKIDDKVLAYFSGLSKAPNSFVGGPAASNYAKEFGFGGKPVGTTINEHDDDDLLFLHWRRRWD